MMHTKLKEFKVKMKKITITLMIILVINLFSVLSCSNKNGHQEIILPSTPHLSGRDQWGVIESSHLRLRDQPSAESTAEATLYRGYVLEILSQGSEKVTVEDTENYWYQVNYDGLNGWVFGSYLKLYSDKTLAERASRQLK